VFLGVIGPNGGGKSTLIRLIAGELKASSGALELWDRDVEDPDARKRIGYVPQFHGGEWEFPATAEEVILMGAVERRSLFGKVPAPIKEMLHFLIGVVGLRGKEKQPIGNLSGGQRQRAFIAQALIRRPELLLLDEPTTGIDSTGQEQFIELIRNIKDTFQLTVVMVSHDIGQLARFTDRIACLNRCIHWHDRSEVLSDEVIQTVYQCELHSIQEHSHREKEETGHI
jgi:zinc transport system ATP-binding protein